MLEQQQKTFTSEQTIWKSKIHWSRNYSFNYDPIVVKVEGIVGISSIEGKNFQCVPQPLFSEVTSVHLTHGGVGYGASEILNFNRQPRIDLYTGVSGELLPVVANGKLLTLQLK